MGRSLELQNAPYSVDLDQLVARVAALESAGLQNALTAAKTLTALQSGNTYPLALAGGFAVTLPAVAAGLRFSFIVQIAPSGGSYTIVAASGTPIHGMAVSKDLNGATDSAGTAGTGVLTITLVDSKAQIGDQVHLVCDGTKWFVRAYTSGNFDAVTLS